ncbi:MAG TPA: DUF6089 family protein [Prolixibacteraceae bacterium]|nr:DUF6089 family protein [Prolixibacteraceae bacterium]
MKHILVVFLFGFLTVEALGQPSVDVGIFGGVGTYFGDMTKVDFQKSVNPAYGGFFRYNFNPRYGLRFNVIYGTIGAEGEFESVQWTFDKNVLDISLQFEFNYLKYIVGDKETPWSSYIFGGVGMQSYNYEYRVDELLNIVDPTYIPNSSGSVISPTIPFGLGVKFDLSKRFGLGIEGGLRKSFSDKLDDLDDPLSHEDPLNAGVQINYTDMYHNNDWTAYMGVHLVYKMYYGNKGWELRTPRKNMLDWGIWNSDRKE